ncbi:1-deoxy-D-xylulose-5-phosphate synthase N-terminal domain-containing protein [Streptomyces liangshanensis]|uniref:1-deoxy-D-xylulose-5-phosphate synthase N-terminal domain-containing protein n=1 Tax=Streptomyces liangshanensis TaxID=2717324 RepID=UPI001FBC0BC7|nr:1-deoxy-D-xylulose-5-phosphate synthase N-terminal domain-containing protein [Streptomyces liangshanensis]
MSILEGIRGPHDAGHQSYVHKLLTGRQDFSKLRGKGGLSGYPSRAESDHDVIENSHAFTVLGWADGLAKANEVRGKDDHVVAVIGDGALTGGVAWEALNNIAAPRDAGQLRAQLRQAVAVDDAPTVVRFPKESAGEPVPAVARVGGMDVLRHADDADVLLVSLGALAPVYLAERGIPSTVVDARWVKPVDVPLRTFGIPEQFLSHAKRSEVPADIGLTPVEIAGRISAVLAHKETNA